MAGGLDKGLASSMWSPISTGRPPYYFKKKPAPPATRLSNASTAVGNNSSPGASPSSSTPLSSPSATSNSRTSDAASKADTSITNTSGTSPSPTSNGEDSPLVAALNRIPTPWSELDRFTKIARRLKWKLPFLAHGYNTATAHVDDGDFDGAAAQQTEAELMFKLDFFEYYMLLERALVHLMGVFGVEITGAFRNGAAVPPKNRGGDGRRAGAVSESGGIGKKSDHRFHANVLEALDDARNPLNKSLGSDEVRYALARAKELRNRWKNADDPDAALSTKARTRPLADYDLERILETIFAGFDAGFLVAQQFVNEVRALAAAQRGDGMDTGNNNDVDMDATEEEGKWGFMTDAMDWELV